jgi:hypothetical protein
MFLMTAGKLRTWSTEVDVGEVEISAADASRTVANAVTNGGIALLCIAFVVALGFAQAPTDQL